MGDLIYLVTLILSVTLLPYWMYRRMLRVRAQVYEQSRLRDAQGLRSEDFVEGERDADGNMAGRAVSFDAQLSEADKAAAAMPDINQTLQGKR
jgi:hypothetical protein